MSEQLHTHTTPMGDFEDPGEDKAFGPLSEETIAALREHGIEFSDFYPDVNRKGPPPEPKWPYWVLFAIGLGILLFCYFMGWI